MVRRFTPFLIAMACASSVLAQQTDPGPGRRLAERYCTSCHEVRPGETGAGPMATAPSFQVIARMPSTTQLSLHVFLRTSHAGMPNILLTEQEINELAAYIDSLDTSAK